MHNSLRSAIGRLCKVLACSYGSTEHCLGTTTELNDPDMFEEFNCGPLIELNGLEIKIVNPNGQTALINKPGELKIRGPGMFKEYYNNKKKTRQMKDNDGWFKTDDLARINHDGELFVEGRMSNVIISKGDNIVPEVMEAVFKKCPGILDVLIVPIPDPVCYQLVCACVIPERGAIITENDIRQYAENVYNSEAEIVLLLPTYYLFLESFPRTNTGKKSRKKMQKLAEQMITEKANVIG